MDVSRMRVTGVTIAGTEDEDRAEYFDGHDDVGALVDPVVDEAEADDTTNAKKKKLDRLEEFAVYETAFIPVALGKKRVTTRWELEHRQDGIRARFVARALKERCTMSLRRAQLRARDASSTTRVSRSRITDSLQT